MHANLMRERRFWPLFWTQFFGAFNDNLFKNALVILVTFRAVHVGSLEPEQMVAASGAIFILPFFLFSSLAGQIADKVDKATVVKWTKIAELFIMAIGAAGFITGHVTLLMFVLFAMGVHSTIFGPCKYSILPQHLAANELVRGNALVEMGTYLAILLGTLIGGIVIARQGGEWWISGACLVVAVLGIATSRFVPSAPSRNPDLKIQWDPFVPTWRLIQLAFRNVVIGRSVLAISWFWTFGSIFLSTFPAYTKDVLGGNEQIATLFLALFSVGIGVGSMLCERLSRERVELGLVPIGSFGMSLFALDLWSIGKPWPTPSQLMNVSQFMSTGAGVHIAIDLVLLAISGGLLIVPLYAFVQWRADPSETSRVIAANNVINAIAMVAGQVGLIAFYKAGFHVVDVMLALCLINTAVAVYIYTVVPEFMLRFMVWALSVVIYRLRVVGHEKIPVDGAVVLVSNHVSFIDWFVVSASVKRPARFVMHKDFVGLPVMSWVFKQAKVIPIASAKEDPVMLEAAFERIHEELKDEQVLCIFPEGKITSTGDMNPFRPGIERIVARDAVPVIPITINGLWGSYFSRKDGKAMTKPFRRFFSRVTVTIGDPVPADQVTAEGLEALVKAQWEKGPA